MKLRVFLLMMAAFFISQSVWAVPARPGFTTYHTADGTEVSLEMVGDEFGHWLQDKEGNAYHLTDDGTVTRSTQTVAQLSKARKSSPRYESSRHRLSGKVNLAPRGIVILVNYKNLSMQSANTQSAFNNMLNASGYNYRNTHNSVREYFRSQSKGQYVPDFDVYGPVTISQNYAYYGANNSYGDDMYPGDVVLEAVQAVKRQYNVDFTLYNNDGDDKVDFVYVIYAGKGEADSDAANTIWPHNSEVYTYFSELCSCPESYLMVDGLYINNYAMSGELDGYTGYRASIGTICHEFGHVLGLPDFYDTGNGSNRTNNLTPCYYDIMDSGSYSGKDSNGTDYCGTCPPNYSPWERIYLGWDTPVNPGTTPANLTLYPVENSNYQCYQINSSGQYQVCTTQAVNYYIENRQQTGWDTYLPGHGMLVWRVDYNSSYWLQNRPNHSNYGSPHYTLVSAYGSAITSGANTYPGTKNVTSWTSLSTRAVTEITESSGIVTAKYMGGSVDRYEQELLYYTAVNNETANVSGDYSVYLYTPEGSLFAVAELVTGNDYSLAGTYGVGVNSGATYNSQIYLNGQYYEVTSGDITLTYQGKYTDGEDIYQVTATDWYVPSLDIYYDMYGTIYGNAVWKTPFVNCGYTTDGCDDAIIPVTDEFDNRCGDNLTWELSSDKKVLTIEGYGDMWDFTLTDMTNNTIPWKSAYTTIEQVILPDGITSIGDYAFFNHRQLTTISLPSSLTRIGMYAFARNAFSYIAIPDAVAYIGDYAFAYATNISSIDLPKNLSYLGTDVFINCSALKTVNYNAVNCQLPDNYDTGNPFYSVRSQITSFNIGNEVQVLPAGLCYKMTNISSVTLPLSLTTLNGNAFYGCSKLSTIAIPKNMNYIGKDVFAACSKLTSVVWNAKTCELAGTSTTNTPFRSICEQITSFIIGDDVETLPIGCCFGMTKLTSVTIPAQLKAIGVYCFHTCSSLKTVRFNSPTPPSATTSSFNGIPADAVAQVPCGAKPAYVASTLPFSTYTTFGDFIYTVTLAVQTPETGSVNWLFIPDCDDNSGVIEATPALHYHFVRWEDEAENVATVGPERTIVVTKDITYTAVFEADHVYVISLYTDGHGSAGADKRSYYAGETATLTATPDEGYDFLRWSDGNEDNPRTLTVTENLTLTAEFVKNSYIVTFVNYDGSELQTSEVGVGETPTYNGNEPSKPADDEYTYTFAGWADGENVYPLGTNLPEVTEDATYTAVYDDVQNEYMVIFQDEDGTVLESNSWYYGETPVYYGSEPTKEDNAEYSYYFAGWDKNIVPVTGDATYTAVYSSERNQYTITFQDEDGTVLESNYWYYGETPMYYGSEPSKEDNAEYSYYFAGWDKDIVAVTGDATYTAVYDSERNQYTITFQDEDGTELQSGLWYYGETPVYNGAEPSQYSDDEYTYYFAGWDKDIVAVTEDATYTAIYTATEALPKDIVLQERESDEYYTQFAEDYDGVTVNTVTLNRQFSQGKWSTLCLPFNVNKAMFGTLNFGSRIYEFRYAAGDGDAGVSLFFSIAKSIEAGKGYIVNADAKLAARTSFVFPGVKIDLSADKGEELNSVAAYDNLEGSSAQGNIELVGTLRKGTLKGSSGDNRYMGLKDNKIYYPNTSSGSTIYAYRGIFRSQTGTLNTERIRIIVDGEDMGELRIDKGEMLMNNSSEPHKFIENGILYIERDGVIYNAQGQRVE